MTLTSATSTRAVLEHHLQCFGAGDLADNAPYAVMFTPSGVLRGPDGMAPLFQGFFAEFAKPGAGFDLQQQSVEGDVAYILWTAETADNTFELGCTGCCPGSWCAHRSPPSPASDSYHARVPAPDCGRQHDRIGS